MTEKKISFNTLEKALATLTSALQKPGLTDLERDGVIQRFEYCFELSWKTMRKVLIHLGRNEVSQSPKPILRDALQEGVIEDIAQWFAFLEARNLASHLYSEDEARKVFAQAKDFSVQAGKLLEKLKAQ